MTFGFTQEEISFIMKKFGYKHLEGFESVRFDGDKCARTLMDKGYISPYRRSYELSNEVRILFSAWVGVKYTIVKDSCFSDDHIFAVFASSKNIFSYSMHFDDIEITLSDFSVEIMDKVLSDYLGVTEYNNSVDCFNISFDADEYLELFGEETPNEAISRRTGLSLENVSLIKTALIDEDGTAFVLQNVVDDIGCMGVISKRGGAYVLVKHIVPNKAMHRQKVVVVKGDAESIINSIYIL